MTIATTHSTPRKMFSHGRSLRLDMGVPVHTGKDRLVRLEPHLNRIRLREESLQTRLRGVRRSWRPSANPYRSLPRLHHARAVSATPTRSSVLVRGSAKATTAPPSGALRARTVPPCSPTTLRTIDKPSPEPGTERAAGER